MFLYFRGGYRQFPNANLGRSFLLNAIASVAVAAALMVRRDVLLRLAGIAIAAGTLAAFYITRNTTKGLFGFTEKGFDPSPEAIIAVVAEIVAVLALLASFLPPVRWRSHPVAGSMPFAIIGAVIMVAAGVGGGIVWANTNSDSAGYSSTPTATTEPEATETSAPDGGSTGEVTIKDFTFQPGDLKIKAGTEVTFTNDDSATHSVQSDGHVFDSPSNLSTGDSFKHTFDKAGTFTYICGIHQAMSGTIEVAP